MSDMRRQVMGDRKRLVDEVLADPSVSAETKTTLLHQFELMPFKNEYRRVHGNVSMAQFKSREAVAFLNKRLAETGKDWRITAENLDATFGNIMINSSMKGPYTTGVKIKGGGGNTFDQTDIGAQTGVDLENTQKNSFRNTRINTPKPSDDSNKELFTLKPGIWGMNIDLKKLVNDFLPRAINEAVRRIRQWRARK